MVEIKEKKQYKHIPLKYYKTDPDVKDPIFATFGSACFDIYAYLSESIRINPDEQFLVPTGLIFDIPYHWSVRLHSRSGLALKKKIVLANAEGIIDSDYVEPVYVMIRNNDKISHFIRNGDRICQAEMVHVPYYDIIEIPNRPEKKTNRDGGFGSTGNV